MRVQGLGYRVQGSWYMVHDLGFRVQGSVFRVQDLRGLRPAPARTGRARFGMKLEPMLGSTALYREDVCWNTSSELSRLRFEGLGC